MAGMRGIDSSTRADGGSGVSAWLGVIVIKAGV